MFYLVYNSWFRTFMFFFVDLSCFVSLVNLTVKFFLFCFRGSLRSFSFINSFVVFVLTKDTGTLFVVKLGGVCCIDDIVVCVLCKFVFAFVELSCFVSLVNLTGLIITKYYTKLKVIIRYTIRLIWIFNIIIFKFDIN